MSRDSDRDDSASPGQMIASSDDDALLRLVRSHAEREGEALASYQRIIEQSDDPGMQYAMGLIMDDEVRHHQHISEMINEVQSSVWELDIRPRVPSFRVRDGAVLLEMTEQLIAFEKEDARELKRLRKETRRNNSYPMFPVLVEMMLHDTAKHIEILTYIRSRLSGIRRP